MSASTFARAGDEPGGERPGDPQPSAPAAPPAAPSAVDTAPSPSISEPATLPPNAQSAPVAPVAPVQPLQIAGDDTPRDPLPPGPVIATDEPPSNWYFLQPGIWPEADRFAGLLQIGLAESRSDRFYGLVQLAGYKTSAKLFAGALELGLIGSDAEQLYGVAQASIGESRAGEIYALGQIALYRSVATRAFYGALQLSLNRNDADLFAGGLQMAARNVTRRMIGVGQIGAYNLTGQDLDKEDTTPGSGQGPDQFVALFQLGALNWHENGNYIALLQLGAMNVSLGDNFIGGAQVAFYNYADRDFYGLGEIAVVNLAWQYHALLQLGVVSGVRNFYGALQAGGINYTLWDFNGVLQLGLVNAVQNDFRGVAQIGAFNVVSSNLVRSLTPGTIGDRGPQGRSGSFSGLLQLGLINIPDKSFRGAFQIGALLTGAEDVYAFVQASPLITVAGRNFAGLLQIGGLAYTDDNFSGLAQLGAVNIVGEELAGAQLGAINIGAGEVAGAQLGAFNYAREIRGVQLGIVNYTRSLTGVQLGVLNLSKQGGLPVSPVLNLGF